jgi:hypothetical protein
MSERTIFTDDEIKSAVLEADAQVTAAILNTPDSEISNLEERVIEKAVLWAEDFIVKPETNPKATNQSARRPLTYRRQHA